MTKRERQTGNAEDQWSMCAARSMGRHKDDARGRARQLPAVRSAFPCLRLGVHRQIGARDHGPGASQNQNQAPTPPHPSPRPQKVGLKWGGVYGGSGPKAYWGDKVMILQGVKLTI